MKSIMNNHQFVSISLLTGSGVLVAVLTLVMLPIQTRLFTAQDFGYSALCIAISSLVGSISTFRYEIAIVVASSIEDAVILARSTLFLSSAVSAVCYLALSLLTDLLPAGDGRSWFKIPEVLIALGVLCFGFFNIMSQWNIRNQFYALQARVQVCIAIIANAYPLVMFYLYNKADWIFLLQAYVLSYLFASIYSFGSSYAVSNWRTSKVGYARILSVLRMYEDFPKFSLPIMISASLRDRGVPILLASFTSFEVTGAFAVLMRLMGMPGSIMSQALRPVLFKTVTLSRFQGGKFLQGVHKFFLVLSLPCLAAVIVFKDFIVGLVLGVEWIDFSNLIIAIMPYAIILCFCNWLDRIFDATNNIAWAASYEVVNVVATVGSLFILLLAGVRPFFSISVYSIVFFCLSICYISRAYDILELKRRRFIFVLTFAPLLIILPALLRVD